MAVAERIAIDHYRELIRYVGDRTKTDPCCPSSRAGAMDPPTSSSRVKHSERVKREVRTGYRHDL